jgi:predicted PurR-regulated permease PerM
MKENSKLYVFWATIALLIILSYLIIKPFIIPIISAFILAYLVRPLDKKLSSRMPKQISAIISIFLVLLIILLPLSAILGGITNQAYQFTNENSLSEVLQSISEQPFLNYLNLNLENLSSQVPSFVASIITSAISQLPNILLTILIIFFGMYYILVSWENLSKSLSRYIPFRNKKQVSKEIAKTTNQLIYGTLLIAIIEFIISVPGFYLIGVKPFLLVSALIFFLAFIPGLGPLIVWVPMAIYYLVQGQYITLLGVIALGIILSTLIDTFLRSKILGEKTKLNPFIMLVGILGGIALFGVFGFIIGPLILIYTIKFLEEALSQN